MFSIYLVFHEEACGRKQFMNLYIVRMIYCFVLLNKKILIFYVYYTQEDVVSRCAFIKQYIDCCYLESVWF